MAPEVVALAQDLLERAGALEVGPPTPLELVLDYLAGHGLELHYYDPKGAPAPIQGVASAVDEALVPDGPRALLFVNQDRPQTRTRFSIFHGIGHFWLPGHRRLSYLGRGCAMQPLTARPYERQAHRFAAAMNMPPRRFRDDMSRLSFGMRAVEELAQRYIASVESAAIHYVTLADVPCAVVWLQPDCEDNGFRQPGSPLKVRYQVRSPSFPFSIRPGTPIPLDDNLFWRCSEEELLAEGSVDGTCLGLKRELELWVDCVPQGHMGDLLALVCPGDMPHDCLIYDDRGGEG